MEEKEVTGVDHGLSGPLASAYRASQERIASMSKAKSVVSTETYKQPKPKKKNTENALAAIMATSTGNIQPVAKQNSDNIVEINNENIPFDIAYPEDTKLMAIGMNAVSVDISEDSVSILIHDDIRMKLPKLVPLHLVVDGQPYKVCWAGGMHKFGKFKHISFVIVE